MITDGASSVSTIDLHPGGAGVVVVDNTAPTVAVGAPTAGSFVSGSGVTISASASDANPLTYDYLVNGSVVASGAAASANWDSTAVADGTVQISVRATDPAGNTTLSAPITVTVDNHAPTPTLNSPGSAISGAPTISATSDADTATVEFQQRPQGGSSWTSIATVGPPFQTPFATGALTDGNYELRAIATDQAGHTGTSPIVTVLVDNTNPTGSLTTAARRPDDRRPGDAARRNRVRQRRRRRERHLRVQPRGPQHLDHRSRATPPRRTRSRGTRPRCRRRTTTSAS